MNYIRSGLILLVFTIPLLSADISVIGTIKDTDGKVIENALIRFENAGYVTVSNVSGGFILSDISPVQRSSGKVKPSESIGFKNGSLHFSVSGTANVVFSAYTLQGKQCVNKPMGHFTTGRYYARLGSLLPPELKSGTYIIAATIGTKRVAEKILHRTGEKSNFSVYFEENVIDFKRVASHGSVADTITISKLGYVSKSLPVTSYQANIGIVTLEKSTALSSANSIEKVEDSLLNLFIERIEAVEDLEGPDELKTIDYISIRNGFEAILEIDSLRVKSNIGYMLSALASLNVNPDVWKIADSLDAYFSEVNSESDPVIGTSSEGFLMKKAMKKGGVLALGKAMAVKTPQIVMAGVQNPSFPKFLTISYLQDLIERQLITVLNNVQNAAERLESLSDASINVVVDGDGYDVDKGEIYLFDASVNMLRAYLYMMCAYDMDLYTSPEKKDYSWIDTLVNIDNNYQRIYSIAGDTLYEIDTWGGDKKNIQTLVSMLHYNLEERPSFMTIRKSFHEVAFNCLKAVPYKIKSGLAAIKAETDDQENDLLKISMIDSANSEMLDLSSRITDEGFSESFADNFSSIDKLMDFVIKLLSGPYTFNEVVHEKSINVTINLPAMFNNPVNDLRTLLPGYVWTSDANWVRPDAYRWEDQYYQRRIVYSAQSGLYDTLYYISDYKSSGDSVKLAFDAALIDSVVTSEWGTTMYYINKPLHYSVTIDSSYYFDALRLKDGSGAVMSSEMVDSLIDAEAFFPYFNDYTFNGLFPNMTREKWLDLIWKE